MEDLRKILCLNLCQAPKDILTADTTVTTLGDDCELTLGLPDGLEVFAYRPTRLPSSDLQEYCWVDFQTIYDQCISKNAAQGWVNGADFAFFKMGVRPNNDPEALHAKDYYGADNHLEVWSPF
jgi:hypothetical protein